MANVCKQCNSNINNNKFVKCKCGTCIHFTCLHEHKSLPYPWSTSTGILKHLTSALTSPSFSFTCSSCINSNCSKTPSYPTPSPPPPNNATFIKAINEINSSIAKLSAHIKSHEQSLQKLTAHYTSPSPTLNSPVDTRPLLHTSSTSTITAATRTSIHPNSHSSHNKLIPLMQNNIKKNRSNTHVRNITGHSHLAKDYSKLTQRNTTHVPNHKHPSGMHSSQPTLQHRIPPLLPTHPSIQKHSSSIHSTNYQHRNSLHFDRLTNNPHSSHQSYPSHSHILNFAYTNKLIHNPNIRLVYNSKSNSRELRISSNKKINWSIPPISPPPHILNKWRTLLLKSSKINHSHPNTQ